LAEQNKKMSIALTAINEQHLPAFKHGLESEGVREY
jgi:hypothetical protein